MGATKINPSRLYYQLQNTGLQQKDPQLYQLVYNLIGTLLSLDGDVATVISGGGGSTVIQQNIGFPPLSMEDMGFEIPMVIPGPRGNDGLIGNIGPSGNDGEDGESVVIPGPIGATGATGATGASGSSVSIPGLDGLDGDDALMIPGPTGADGANGMVPYFIASTETFIIPLYKQAVFAMNIDNEGMLEIDGFLIEVDEIGTSGSTILNQAIYEDTYEGDNFQIINQTNTTAVIQNIFQLFEETSEEYNFRPPNNQYPIVLTTTSTGSQNDFDPGLSFGDIQIRCNNATDLTLTGLKAGYDGQRIIFVSIGAGNVLFTHQSGSSVATNRLINFITSGVTPIAAGTGNAVFQYDGTTGRWRLISHSQGAFIAVPYASGNFTGGGAQTWTVDSGDVNTYAYFINGKSIFFNIYLSTTSVGGTPDPHLNVTLPNSYTLAKIGVGFAQSIDNGSTALGLADWAAGDTAIGFRNSLVIANWAASTNNTYVRSAILTEIN